MNKKSLFGAVFSLLVLPIAVFAQLQGYAPGAPHIGSLAQVVGNIELLVGFIFGAIAVISFVVAGVMFLTSQGEPEKLTKARSAVIWGVAGIVVGIVAFSIIALVGNFIA